jgi:hypothetical protein
VLLELHQTFGYVLLPELTPKLLPGDGVGGVMSFGVSIPQSTVVPSSLPKA